MADRRSSGPMVSFNGLLQAADAESLRELVRKLVANRVDLWREAIDYLRNRVPLSPSGESDAATLAIAALWLELEAYLTDLEAYGGGDDDETDRIIGLLGELTERLQTGDLMQSDRRRLRQAVLWYIRNGNTGVDDALYDVAYATCHDETDLRHLAEGLEAMGQDWPLDHARRIYRSIGDRGKYLALRARKMEYGGDYYDLATFYWEAGEQSKAVQVAREGMAKASGRMDELRAFLSERALESGDRQEYLKIQFAQAMDRMTVQSYMAFREMCTETEWTAYEPQVVAELARATTDARLQIHMLRKEYDQAIRVLSKQRYWHYDDSATLKVAAQLEERFPTQVLAFYQTGLGNLNMSGQRQEYARNARVAVKLRHMWVDVMKTPDRWLEFARKIKYQNQRRPAFQEEFARVIPDWKGL